MMKKAPTLARLGRCHAIGIDVSKATLEVVGLESDQVWQVTIENGEAAIEALARGLHTCGYPHKVVCEATGHYHLLLGLVFSRYGLDLRIVNPLQSSKHQKSRVRKTKTDAVDAYTLATMCLTERDLPAAAQLESRAVLIRLKQGQLHALEKQLQRMKRSLSTYTGTYAQLGLEAGASATSLHQVVTDLEAARRQLQRELETLLAEQVPGNDELERLRQLPGYSNLVTGLVGTVFDRGAKSDKSWVAYAGLDVSVRESGTWRGRGRLTKRGNSYLRKRLYCAAWGAMMHYDEVRHYYDRLKEAGRNHVEALCIIARKLLRIAYAILVKGKEYDPKIAFAG